MKAIWNGQVVAESDDTVVVEGNHYFPSSALDDALLEASDTQSYCPWKGTASYFHLTAGGETSRDAVWYYPDPKEAASMIDGRVAFWNGVEVVR